MKESDHLKKKLDETLSDIRAFGIEHDIERAEKLEQFEEEFLPKLQSRFGKDISYNKQTTAYTITIYKEDMDKFIIIDYYAKADKLLVRHENRWYRKGRQWLTEQYDL